MKYETLKKNIASACYTRVLTAQMPGAQCAAAFDAMAEHRPPRESLQALANETYDLVMRWDIRCIDKLRTIFPEQFPKRLQNGPLVAHMADNADCDWIVECAIK